MGDRANVYCREVWRDGSEGGVYFYSHYYGRELALVVKDALIRGKERWSEFPFLHRIIFSEMIQDDVSGDCGFCISTRIIDNSYPVIVVDCSSGSVGFALDGEEPKCVVQWFFEEYVAMSDTEIIRKFMKARKPMEVDSHCPFSEEKRH